MFKRVWALLVAVLLLVLIAPASAASAAGTVTWQGYQWDVRTWAGEPGKSGAWSAANVSVDSAGKLHLRLTRDSSGRLLQAEIDSVREGWGYGTYRWTVDTDLSGFHPEHVLGLFTYGSDPGYAHREIDVEAAGWGHTPVNWDYSVQTTGKVIKQTPVRAGASTHEFRWEPGRVSWTSWDASGQVMATASTTSAVPVPGDEQVMMNLWACAACSNLAAVPAPLEVVLSGFSFVPLGATPAPSPTVTASPTPAPVVTSPSPTPVEQPRRHPHRKHWWRR